MAANLAGKLEVEMEVHTTPEKLWTTILNSAEIFPKAFPELYKSVEILEGDGKTVGSVRLVKYADGLPLVTISKEKVEEVDEASKTMAYTVIDGEMKEAFKSFKARVSVSTKGEGKGEGSLIKWTCEYEKVKEDIPEPTFVTDFTVKVFKDLDAYLLKPQA